MSAPASTHTALPWKFVGEYWNGSHDATSIGSVYSTEADQFVLTLEDTGDDNSVDEQHANAELIVRAVNNHQALIDALKGVVRVADRKTVEFDAAREAIARAEGR